MTFHLSRVLVDAFWSTTLIARESRRRDTLPEPSPPELALLLYYFLSSRIIAVMSLKIKRS